MIIEKAGPEDAQEILNLQKTAYQSEGQLYNDFNLPPLVENLKKIRPDFDGQLFLKAVIEGEIVGSVRAYMRGDTCYIGRLTVRHDLQDQGIGTKLLEEVEGHFGEAKRYELFTGHRSEKALHIYEKRGYRICRTEPIHNDLTLVYLEKTPAKP
jgi:ribosomal protein S18 acetylase RimI-like enzyme